MLAATPIVRIHALRYHRLPVQINSPKDLGSLLRFLQICKPLDDEEFFKRLILRPLAIGDPEGTNLLTVRPLTQTDRLFNSIKALMAHVCLRRTKEVRSTFSALDPSYEYRYRCKTRMATRSFHSLPLR